MADDARSSSDRSSFRAHRGRATELDRLIHGRVRLGIMSALATGEALTFTEMKELLDTSDGNLSVHARKLEEAGYVKCIKSFEDRRPKTEYRITDEGREAFRTYVDEMERLLDVNRGDASA